MRLSREQRLPLTWAWAWLWVSLCPRRASTASATVTSSNSSAYGALLPLEHADGGHAPIAQLLPLTRAAAYRQIQANLYNTNFSSVVNISANDIAYINCNTDDYPGFVTPQTVFENAYRNANLSGVILYSTATDYCDYQQSNKQDMMQEFPILTMTNKTDSAALYAAISNLPASAKYLVLVQGRADNTSNASSTPASNPLGPSPSTAVAMIILYSITGIITALFLVIIITGAIRAHRHPERYGPRDVLGRPRQSRARGLGRAILDTLPIVKFGEKDPAKTADVELGSTAETRDVNEPDHAAQASQGLSEGEPIETTTASAIDVTQTSREAAQTSLGELQEGIAPAQAPVVSSAVSENNTFHEENLGCSICTEDFEKGQDLRVLPCDHKFHPECVDPWLLNVSGTCPLCRVDLRPVTSRDSTDSHDPEELAPPINPEAETSHRRRTAFRDILSLRHRPNASTEERISALRRLREQRRDQVGEIAEGSANASTEDVVGRDRRSKRLSVRLSGVFGGRTRRERREESPAQQGEPSTSALQQTPPRDESTIPPPDTTPSERQA